MLAVNRRIPSFARAFNSSISSSGFLSRSCSSIPEEEKYAELYTRRRKNTCIKVDLVSLRKFRELHGHLNVPQNFAFSPDEQLGHAATSLGKHVKVLRARYRSSVDKTEPWIQTLTKNGFVWSGHDESWRLLILGLQHYHSIHGDYYVPVDFIIPFEGLEGWPRELHERPLGKHYQNLRTKKLPEEKVWELNRLGIPIKYEGAQKLFDAIELYKNIYGLSTENKLAIDRHFVVPLLSKEWPESFWDYPLGMNLEMTRTYPESKTYRRIFQESGVELYTAVQMRSLENEKMKKEKKEKKEKKKAAKQARHGGGEEVEEEFNEEDGI